MNEQVSLRGDTSENSGWDLRHVNNRRACRVSVGVSVFGRARTLSFFVRTKTKPKPKHKAERDVVVLRFIKELLLCTPYSMRQLSSPGVVVVSFRQITTKVGVT